MISCITWNMKPFIHTFSPWMSMAKKRANSRIQGRHVQRACRKAWVWTIGNMALGSGRRSQWLHQVLWCQRQEDHQTRQSPDACPWPRAERNLRHDLRRRPRQGRRLGVEGVACVGDCRPLNAAANARPTNLPSFLNVASSWIRKIDFTRPIDEPHLLFFDKISMRHLLMATGFIDIKLDYVGQEIDE